MDFTFLISSLGYLLAIIFTYLISESIPKNYFNYLVYAIILIISSVYISLKLPINLDDLIYSTHNNMFSLIGYVTYTIIVNIICNEIGIKEYLITSSFMISVIYFSFILLFWKTSFSEIFKVYSHTKFLDSLIYYIVSLSIYISTIIYTQVYGIMYTNMIQISNLLFLMYKNEYNSYLVVSMYIIFIFSNLRKNSS